MKEIVAEFRSSVVEDPYVGLAWSLDATAVAVRTAGGAVDVFPLADFKPRRLPLPAGIRARSICWGQSLFVLSQAELGRFDVSDSSHTYDRVSGFGGKFVALNHRTGTLAILHSYIDEAPRQPNRRRHEVALVDPATWTCNSILSVAGLSSYPTTLAFCPVDDALLVARYNGRVQCLARDGSRKSGEVIFPSIAATALAILADRTVAIGANDGRVEFRNFALEEVGMSAIRASERRIVRIEELSSRDGLLVLDGTGMLTAWSISGRDSVAPAEIESGAADFSLHPTGKRLAIVSPERVVVLAF